MPAAPAIASILSPIATRFGLPSEWAVKRQGMPSRAPTVAASRPASARCAWRMSGRRSSLPVWPTSASTSAS